MADFGKLNFSVSFNPTSAFPLDSRYYFDSYADAQAAAASAVEVGLATGTYFFGEEIVVVENNKATLYVIQPDSTLTPVGTTPVGDEKSVIVAEDGTISLKGIDGLTFTDDEGKAIQYQPLMTASGLTWVVPSATTVEGLDLRLSGVETTVGNAEGGLVKDVADLQTTVGDAESGLVKEVADVKADLADNYYNKDAVDGLVAGAFHFKGSADSVDEDGDLVVDGNKITSQKQGDVYQVGEKEYAWNGESWTELGFTIDLTNYATTASVTTAKEEAIAAAASDATTKADKALADAKTYTDEQITGLGIGDYAKTSEVTSAISTAKTELQGYADQAEADAIAAAATATDIAITTKVGEIEGTVKSYVDGKETTLTSAINAQKDRIDALGTLASKSEVTETELAGALKDKIDNKADKATTLAGYGIGDAYTKTEVDDLISPVSTKANANEAKLTGLTETTVIAEINKAKEEAISSAEAKVNALATGAVATNTADIEAIKNADTGILATAKKYTDDEIDKVENTIADLTTSVEGVDQKIQDAISAEVTRADGAYDKAGAAEGALAEAKSYADGKDAAITTAQEAAEAAAEAAGAAQADVDALEAKVGEVPTGTTLVEMIADAQEAATYDDTEVRGLIKDNTDAITVLNGEGTGSVKKAVDDAINKFATDITDDEVVNSYKELIDWVATHGSEAGEIAKDIQALETILTGIGGEGEKTTVIAYVNDAIDALKIGDYAKATDLTALATRVKAIEDDYLKTADKTALLDAIDGKVDKVDGKSLVSDTLIEKLEGIEAGAEVNVIESISVDGTALSVENKGIALPLATAVAAGLVKSSTAENGILINDDHTMTVNSLNINKLVQTEGDYLILDGGSAVISN